MLSSDTTLTSVKVRSFPNLTMFKPASGVVVQHLQVDGSAGETKIYQNPSFYGSCVVVCQDGSEYVRLAVGEGRLDRLDCIRHVVFKGRETFLVEFEASRAGLL